MQNEQITFLQNMKNSWIIQRDNAIKEIANIDAALSKMNVKCDNKMKKPKKSKIEKCDKVVTQNLIEFALSNEVILEPDCTLKECIDLVFEKLQISIKLMGAASAVYENRNTNFMSNITLKFGTKEEAFKIRPMANGSMCKVLFSKDESDGSDLSLFNALFNKNCKSESAATRNIVSDIFKIK